ncbi:hypothetical protein DES38_1095 [Streptohalobacillus salinus]|uniref:KAP NTPase domain-containing protein n=1 Tax=Streptohalobacillus salinus TaxID=621096 RepID=A0A2V3WLZ4_9BACI|nr:hypothetical protein [Streptohalobacillus salinus]PXW89769.1 hypothetical protein DES38_1095 [Streptohalobacillus salinus]
MIKIEAQKIIKVMNKLDVLPYQKIMFDGKWGIGKTKYILESTNDKENVYYISLFGKRDINTIYQELYYLLIPEDKVKFNKILNKIGKINYSQFGFNVSIPLIADMFKNVQAELESTSNITIIIDDLERKQDDFNIKEVFGFVDTITKREGIKVVLVASSDNFSNETKKQFEEYAEKSLDRIYKISTYSKDAPQKIMGDDIWLAIQDIYQENKLKNLRTLEKANLFIKEVLNEIPVSVLNDRISKEDIYKICFSIVLFEVDLKGNMEPLTDIDEKSRKSFYEAYDSEEKIPNYIWHYILKRALKNSMMYNFVSVILDWFSTGEFSINRFNDEAKLVNSYVELKYPLFMSEKELAMESGDFSIFICNINQDISFKNFLQRLDELATITEKTEIGLNYKVDEVVDWMTNKYDFDNYDTTYFEHFVRRESKFINEVILKLQDKARSNYINNLVLIMVNNANKLHLTNEEINVTVEFIGFFNKLNDEEKDIVVEEMQKNKWFLPFPFGEITEYHWTYCHNIFQFIVEIDKGVKTSLVLDAREYFEREIDKHSDEIFKYRLRHLIKQYL